MPSPRPDASWVARLQSKPFFGSIETVWKEHGIPDWIAEGVIANEDTSLDLGATGSDAPSVGLYQINLDAHPDVTRAEASDPLWSSQWFANKVAPILAADPELKDPANLPVLVNKLEAAGWPGYDPSLDAQEYPQRVADMQAVLAQNNAVANKPQPTKGQYQDPFSTWWQQFTKHGWQLPDGSVTGGDSGSFDPFGLKSLVNNSIHTVALVLLGLVLLAVAIIWLAGHEIADAMRESNSTAPATTGESRPNPAAELATDALVA